jgi:hypothetical protein
MAADHTRAIVTTTDRSIREAYRPSRAPLSAGHCSSSGRLRLRHSSRMDDLSCRILRALADSGVMIDDITIAERLGTYADAIKPALDALLRARYVNIIPRKRPSRPRDVYGINPSGRTAIEEECGA